jgi:putative thioredoxin
MADSPFILDVGDAEFEREVVARSRDLPVVVDFWAPWCGPCRQLGPLLERVAEEMAGAFLLVKINVDAAQQVAARFEVRSIPLVIGFRDGEPVAQFVGAKPEGEIRRFVARLVPSEAEQLARAGDLAAPGDPAAAETHYRDALELEPHCAAARLGLARLLAERDESDPALELLEALIGTAAQEREADRLAAALRTRAAAAADESELRAAAEADPEAPGPRLALGRTLAANQRFEEALEQLIAAIRCDAEFENGAARRAVLDVFELLGGDDPLTQRFRRELAGALYR